MIKFRPPKRQVVLTDEQLMRAAKRDLDRFLAKKNSKLVGDTNNM